MARSLVAPRKYFSALLAFTEMLLRITSSAMIFPFMDAEVATSAPAFETLNAQDEYVYDGHIH